MTRPRRPAIPIPVSALMFPTLEEVEPAAGRLSIEDEAELREQAYEDGHSFSDEEDEHLERVRSVIGGWDEDGDEDE